VLRANNYNLSLYALFIIQSSPPA